MKRVKGESVTGNRVKRVQEAKSAKVRACEKVKGSEVKALKG